MNFLSPFISFSPSELLYKKKSQNSLVFSYSNDTLHVRMCASSISFFHIRMHTPRSKTRLLIKLYQLQICFISMFSTMKRSIGSPCFLKAKIEFTTASVKISASSACTLGGRHFKCGHGHICVSLSFSLLILTCSKN